MAPVPHLFSLTQKPKYVGRQEVYYTLSCIIPSKGAGFCCVHQGVVLYERRLCDSLSSSLMMTHEINSMLAHTPQYRLLQGKPCRNPAKARALILIQSWLFILILGSLELDLGFRHSLRCLSLQLTPKAYLCRRF